MPGGLGQVGIDAHHDVEGGEGGIEAPAIGGGEDGIAGDGDEAAQSRPIGGRGVDFLGEGRRRELAEDACEAANPGAFGSRDADPVAHP